MYTENVFTIFFVQKTNFPLLTTIKCLNGCVEFHTIRNDSFFFFAEYDEFDSCCGGGRIAERFVVLFSI